MSGPSGIPDAMPSTSTGQSKESQWLPSWQSLDEFKEVHDAAVLSEMDTISQNGASVMSTEECGAKCDTLVSSTSFGKTKGRPAGKKKMSTQEKKQKAAERKKLERNKIKKKSSPTDQCLNTVPLNSQE